MSVNWIYRFQFIVYILNINIPTNGLEQYRGTNIAKKVKHKNAIVQEVTLADNEDMDGCSKISQSEIHR